MPQYRNGVSLRAGEQPKDKQLMHYDVIALTLLSVRRTARHSNTRSYPGEYWRERNVKQGSYLLSLSLARIESLPPTFRTAFVL